MISDDEIRARYYVEPAAAHVRATIGDAAARAEDLIRIGIDRAIKLHRYKRTSELARVRRVIGVLQSLQPTSLLDIGSGRGTFLWPLIDAFPSLPITAVERDPERARTLALVPSGGLSTLAVLRADATAIDLADDSCDVATLLEVLEHVPDPEKIARETMRIAKRYVVASVPSKPDDNPEHIHLFDSKSLEKIFYACGARRVTFDWVLNHMIAVVRIED